MKRSDEQKAREKEEHQSTASVCEHGVSRCKICNPPNRHK